MAEWRRSCNPIRTKNHSKWHRILVKHGLSLLKKIIYFCLGTHLPPNYLARCISPKLDANIYSPGTIVHQLNLEEINAATIKVPFLVLGFNKHKCRRIWRTSWFQKKGCRWVATPFLGEGKHWTKWSQGSLERQPSAASQAQVVAAIGGTRPDRALKSSCETVLRQACEVEGFTVWRFFGVQRCEGVVFCCGPCYLTCFVYFFRANVFGWMNRRGVGVDHRPSDGGKTYFCMENWMVLECFGWVHHQVDVFFHWFFGSRKIFVDLVFGRVDWGEICLSTSVFGVFAWT